MSASSTSDASDELADKVRFGAASGVSGGEAGEANVIVGRRLGAGVGRDECFGGGGVRGGTIGMREGEEEERNKSGVRGRTRSSGRGGKGR